MPIYQPGFGSSFFDALAGGLPQFRDQLQKHLDEQQQRQQQLEALKQLMAASQQTQTTNTPVQQGTFPAQPGSGGPGQPTRLPVPAQPIMGVNQTQEQVPVPMSDPHLQAAFLQMFQQDPNTAKAWGEMNIPTYAQKEIPAGGTLGTFENRMGQPPKLTGKTEGQPRTAIRSASDMKVSSRVGPDNIMYDLMRTPDNQFYEVAAGPQLAKPVGGSGAPDARLDKSYQFHTTQISALAKPLQDRADRIERLKVSMDQNSPQADALIAPELLTAMAGGQGSGLRMNEAEISRIVGGRNHWEDLKSAALKWQTDPSKPFQITPAQRQQVRALVDQMSGLTTQRLDAVNEAQQKLALSQNADEHKKIFSALRKQLAGSPIPSRPTPATTGRTKPLEQMSQAELDAYEKQLSGK